MLGAEVAGGVLGIVPTLVSGLDHYSEGVRTIQKMRNASVEFQRLKRILQTEHTMFQNSLELLLKDNVDDRTLPELLRNTRNASLWADPALDDCLKQQLGLSYETYVASARAMDDTIKEFIECLQLNEDGKASFDSTDRKSVIHGLKSIKHGLKMKAYQELMDEISRRNQRISKLITQSISQERVRETTRKIPDFEKARRYAQSLFTALQSSLMGSCSFRHTASLYMPPFSSIDGRRVANVHTDRHRVVFHHQTPAKAHTPSTWITEEAEVHPLEPDSDDDDESTDVNAVVAANPALTRSAVRFALLKSATIKAQQRQSLQEIRDLCASLRRLQTTPMNFDSCFGYVSDTVIRHRHAFYRPRKPFVVTPRADTIPPFSSSSSQLPPPPSSSPFSVEAAAASSSSASSSSSNTTATTLHLSQVLDPKSGYGLSEVDKRRLAHALALGMLRLHNTAWLARQWGRHEVVLFQPRGASGGSVMASHPFISAEVTPNRPGGFSFLTTTTGAASSEAGADFAAEAAAAEHFRTARYFRPCQLIQEPTVFALGILLIELALGAPFDALVRPEDLQADGSRYEFTDFSAAARLVEDVYLRAGERYGDVVKRCIFCEFDHSEKSLLDAEFRRKVYHGVIAELEMDVNDILNL